MADDHPMAKYAGVLKDLAEGRTEPDDWVAWWNARRGARVGVVPSGLAAGPEAQGLPEREPLRPGARKPGRGVSHP